MGIARGAIERLRVATGVTTEHRRGSAERNTLRHSLATGRFLAALVFETLSSELSFSPPMKTLIPNCWEPTAEGVAVASILQHDVHPEGLDFERVRFTTEAPFALRSDSGTLLSVLSGRLELGTAEHELLMLEAGTHVYLPPNSQPRLRGHAGTNILYASSPTADRARGSRMMVRSDRFIAGCAVPQRSLRWILTPQYLSRRAFLHHDQTLISPRGEPLSWFHTTMFDAHGLPVNDEGSAVFKMSYNHRTEPNVCYDVQGTAQVRMAQHPYSEAKWGPWQSLSSEATYHLCEDVHDAEMTIANGKEGPRRNKHEVQIVDGHVSLMCMHNPGCTGAERHSEGEYSGYGDLADVLGTAAYREHLDRLVPLDAVVDSLSLAVAMGNDPTRAPEWSQYQEGLACQRAVEADLLESLRAEGHGREQILASWVLGSG